MTVSTFLLSHAANAELLFRSSVAVMWSCSCPHQPRNVLRPQQTMARRGGLWCCAAARGAFGLFPSFLPAYPHIPRHAGNLSCCRLKDGPGVADVENLAIIGSGPAGTDCCSALCCMSLHLADRRCVIVVPVVISHSMLVHGRLHCGHLCRSREFAARHVHGLSGWWSTWRPADDHHRG